MREKEGGGIRGSVPLIDRNLGVTEERYVVLGAVSSELVTDEFLNRLENLLRVGKVSRFDDVNRDDTK